MITYKTHHLVEKFLSDIEYQAQTDNVRAQQAKMSLCTGLRGFDWQIGGLRVEDIVLMVGPNKRLNQAFCAFIMHSLCWKQHKLKGRICVFDELAGRWLELLLSAETGIAVDWLRFGFCKVEDREKIQKAVEKLENLPFAISEIAPKEAVAEEYSLPTEDIILLADFPLEEGKDYENFFRKLKTQAMKEAKIVLISCTQDRDFCEQMNMGTPLRRFGLIDSWCDFVCLLADAPVQHFDETGREILVAPYKADAVYLKTLKNARLPTGLAEFICHFYNPDFKDKPA